MLKHAPRRSRGRAAGLGDLSSDGGSAYKQLHCEIAQLRRALGHQAADRLSLQALIDRVPDHLYVKDARSRFVIANRAVADNYSRAEPGDMFGLTDFDLGPLEAAQQFYDIEQNIIRTGQPMIDMEEVIFDPAGGKKWLSTSKVPLRNDENEVVGLVGIGREITARKHTDVLRDGQGQILEMIAMNAPLESVLDHLARLIESQLTGIFCSILLLDEDGLRLRHGAAPSLPAAYTKAIDGAPIGPDSCSCGSAVYRRETIVAADIMTDARWSAYRELAAAHRLRSCWARPVLSHQGAVLGTFAMYSREVRRPGAAETRLIEAATHFAGIAIERKRAEDRIQFMANHDALTGLPNRTLLKDRFAQAMSHARRHDSWVTVAFIDLDNFKLVNDSLGHNAGDELLKIVAARMVNRVRALDTVVRLGGDEFVILLFDQPKNVDIITATIQKIRAAIAEPIRIAGHDLQIASSIGLVNYPDDGADADTLLANADAAMYRAKQIGRDNFQFYTPELNVKAHEKFLLREELRNAILRSEFILLYQPQVDSRTGRLLAVEALIRWRHPTRGATDPARFIPIAEETGLIVPIGDWALREACRRNKAWQEAGLPPITICVNVSARQFAERNWVGRVADALRDSGLAAEYLELELTESLIMQDAEQAVETMKELQRLGVQLSIDDFGTGYSSLSALKRFPVHRLKIDKSFIENLPEAENDRAVVSAVISLGQKLNLRIIAEGVETEAQAAFLRENNCNEMQGYLFSEPLPAACIEEFIRARSRLTPDAAVRQEAPAWRPPSSPESVLPIAG
jgi:diguanylate cyclase (GGDEF)-like protein/PAS domain S-box-containing protein